MSPPGPDAVGHLKPTAFAGLMHTGLMVAALVLGVWLSVSAGLLGYLVGQVLLAFGFVHAFVLLHEAGHDTLFGARALNRLVGHMAGFVALIPFCNWQGIHRRHHDYTGWQDMDATTASLVPYPLGRWERRCINFCWTTWLPVFALSYRLQNFWNLGRIGRYLSGSKTLGRIRVNSLTVLAGYGALLVWVGPVETVSLLGPGFMLSLVVQEALILSQHTHVPQRVSGVAQVRVFPPREQEAFTRSLRLPTWLSFLLMHFDAHGLHHMYPQVPGYRLRQIPYQPRNEVHWWRWLKVARGLSGSDFLFRNWDDTGLRV